MYIDLSSDTVTRPSEEMLKAMMRAEVGDDVFRADPTVNALENKAAKMFGKEAAIFCPSGTMTNQIAIKMHTQPLDEMICHELSHVYLYEAGGYAFNSNIAITLLSGQNGKITAHQVKNAIKPRADWMPISKLVVIENTTNKAGGSYYTLNEVEPIAKVCKENNLKLHLDGARLFNALEESKESTEDWGQVFDSISICLSKGLGAPVGSLLLGTMDDINNARRFRKVLGGGMRQAGFLAAAGQYALDYNIKRLSFDHAHAQAIAKTLATLSYVVNIRPVKTNIIIFDLSDNVNTEDFLAKLKQHNVHTVAMGPNTIRFVFHLDITSEMIEKVQEALVLIDKEM